MAKDRSANRRRPLIELTGDQVRDLESAAPGAGIAINERLRVIAQQLEASSGLRGQVNLADALHMEGNAVKEVADPTSDDHAVNLRTLKKALQCANLVSIIQECWEYSEVLDDEVEVAGTPLVSGADYIIAGRIYAPSQTTTASFGAGDLNKVAVFAFVLPFDFSPSAMVLENTGASAGKFFAGGIYNALGSLIVDSGPQSLTAAGRKSISFSPKALLPAGSYYVAWTEDASVALRVTNALTIDAQNMMNQNKVRVGFANNSASASAGPLGRGARTSRGIAREVFRRFGIRPPEAS